MDMGIGQAIAQCGLLFKLLELVESGESKLDKETTT
jgi:hypothetical protein